MSERDYENDAERRTAEPEGEHEPREASSGEQESQREARDELFEAIDHFRNAANMFFDRALNDPAVKNATDEAERVFQKIGQRAEPFARQLTGELSKLTKRITDTYQHTVEGGRKRSSDSSSSDES